jgi:hypothetical protein
MMNDQLPVIITIIGIIIGPIVGFATAMLTYRNTARKQDIEALISTINTITNENERLRTIETETAREMHVLKKRVSILESILRRHGIEFPSVPIAVSEVRKREARGDAPEA